MFSGTPWTMAGSCIQKSRGRRSWKTQEMDSPEPVEGTQVCMSISVFKKIFTYLQKYLLIYCRAIQFKSKIIHPLFHSSSACPSQESQKPRAPSIPPMQVVATHALSQHLLPLKMCMIRNQDQKRNSQDLIPGSLIRNVGTSGRGSFCYTTMPMLAGKWILVTKSSLLPKPKKVMVKCPSSTEIVLLSASSPFLHLSFYSFLRHFCHQIVSNAFAGMCACLDPVCPAQNVHSLREETSSVFLPLGSVPLNNAQQSMHDH